MLRNVLLVIALMVAFCAATLIGARLGVALSEGAELSVLDCEGLKDADQRHYCRAVVGGDKSECELIRDDQLRRRCRAMSSRK